MILHAVGVCIYVAYVGFRAFFTSIDRSSHLALKYILNSSQVNTSNFTLLLTFGFICGLHLIWAWAMLQPPAALQ